MLFMKQVAKDREFQNSLKTDTEVFVHQFLKDFGRHCENRNWSVVRWIIAGVFYQLSVCQEKFQPQKIG